MFEAEQSVLWLMAAQATLILVMLVNFGWLLRTVHGRSDEQAASSNNLEVDEDTEFSQSFAGIERAHSTLSDGPIGESEENCERKADKSPHSRFMFDLDERLDDFGGSGSLDSICTEMPYITMSMSPIDESEGSSRAKNMPYIRGR